MIDINKIRISTIDKNVEKFLKQIENKSGDEIESKNNVYKSIMNFSILLIENYHKELKSELSKYGIEI